mmetsp:Transcript_8520/g.24441  ORF Transcript_8520/g.24441 Transcript_8520/m.24441 type:complete len:671 (-) Transcript_8520:194-2206(-)|eukprot:CAMPEP_0117663442 /NCGR_PEP_ID=MMETSP0804-20121206/8608_1 /TAXON_ID=1074897 /ORGANISM="Tetraselmis astigmatica, Strain CCMP880" /LENGTH=670 /DNA_ID=CAMNT_0005470447 /DNA_START=111 /DNA_END=2123 /DNA_ORIENTATION=+
MAAMVAVDHSDSEATPTGRLTYHRCGLAAGASGSTPAATGWYHEGELSLQSQVPNAREKAEVMAEAIIRTELVPPHRDFLDRASLLYLAVVTEAGSAPKAAVLAGHSGFAVTSDPGRLALDLDRADLSLTGMLPKLAAGALVAVLAMDTRAARRHRVNGVVEEADDHRILVRVDQSFSGCPKYIQQREFDVTEGIAVDRPRGAVVVVESGSSDAAAASLSAAALQLVANADTFFIASAYQGGHASAIGADMSHRGGFPGFVQASDDGTVLRWPDYSGNKMFTTLGNLLADPASALLFVDFASGDVLYVNGRAEVELQPDRALPGGERSVRLQVSSWRLVAKAVPVSCHSFLQASPYNPGHPGQAGPSVGSAQVTVVKVRDEADSVKTLEICAPPVSRPLLAGQHAAFSFPPELFHAAAADKLQDWELPYAIPEEGDDVLRTWTVSSHHEGGMLAAGGTFTISVKLQPGGLVSSYLHSCIKPGATLNLLGFGGAFTMHMNLDFKDTVGLAAGEVPEEGPVLLLGAGIGVTPLVPFLKELRASWPDRRVVVLLSVPRMEQAAFGGVLEEAAKQSSGKVLTIITATRAPEGQASGQLPPLGCVTKDMLEAAGGALRTSGRVEAATLRSIVGGEDIGRAITLMCGPGAFMSAAEEMLKEAGADTSKVYHESFYY